MHLEQIVIPAGEPGEVRCPCCGHLTATESSILDRCPHLMEVIRYQVHDSGLVFVDLSAKARKMVIKSAIEEQGVEEADEIDWSSVGPEEIGDLLKDCYPRATHRGLRVDFGEDTGPLLGYAGSVFLVARCP